MFPLGLNGETIMLNTTVYEVLDFIYSSYVKSVMSYINDENTIDWYSTFSPWWRMALRNLINIGSGNDLLSNVTKPLSQPKLTYLQRGPVVASECDFTCKIYVTELCLEIAVSSN